jgi:putative aldouronate transport system permease protein
VSSGVDLGTIGLAKTGRTGRELRPTRSRAKLIRKHWQYYLIFAAPLLYVIIFGYIPMGGILLAFKSYRITQGILGSPWAGLRYFEQFFNSPRFWTLLQNTLSISIYSLLAGFPIPIIFALMLNETTSLRFKRSVQLVTYAPYFISTVVMVSIIMQFLDPRIGFINRIIVLLGGQARNFMGQASIFQSIYVWSGIWQNTGYAAIIYIAALSSIDPTLYEAAFMDGASRFRKMIHIDIPGLLPTIVILLILSVGGIMNVGFEKVFLMQNALNLSNSEIIATYVYKIGILSSQFSFGTAVGLFNSVINLILIAAVNQIARRIGETSLW